MFDKGTIRILAAAQGFIKLIPEDKMKDIDEQISKHDRAANTNEAK